MGEIERNREHQRKNVTIPEDHIQIATLSGEERIGCGCRKNGTNTEHINICGKHYKPFAKFAKVVLGINN